MSAALEGVAVDSGHHVAEENPEDLSRVLVEFLRPWVRGQALDRAAR